MGPFKGEVPVFVLLWPGRVRVRVRITTGAVRSAILATAGLLVVAALLSVNPLTFNDLHFSGPGRADGPVSLFDQTITFH